MKARIVKELHGVKYVFFDSHHEARASELDPQCLMNREDFEALMDELEIEFIYDED